MIRDPRSPFRPRLELLEDRLAPAVLPANFAESVVASGLSAPTTMEFSPDGRLFVAEQGGKLKVFANGALVQNDFFRDTPLTVDSRGERGLLGIAFDPAYAANHFVYVYYTATTPAAHNRISRFTADAAGDLALAGSEHVVFDLDNLSSATNHNGGAIHFGPDGKLYASVGENANGANSQSLNTVLGKLLRINADGSIPADNPFVASTTGHNQAIWALGLRNPFTFAFEPGTGRLFINDVGQSSFEEIDEGRAGANYGWPDTEGPTSDPRFQGPLYSYDHSQGCAIVGAAFYDPITVQFPAAYKGTYFFADLCSGFIRSLDPATGTATPFASGIASPVDLLVDPAGNLYYLSQGSGAVFQVHFTAPPSPPPPASPPAATVGAFDPSTGTWYLRNSSSAGAPDFTPFAFGLPGWLPVAGDWDGNGSVTIGVVDPTTMTWYLRNSNSAGAPDVTPFAYGLPGWAPVIGDWAGTGHAGVGAFDPASATWYLRNDPSGGAPDVAPFAYGGVGWQPVAGDWDGNGTASVGVVDPATMTWYLRNSNAAGAPDVTPFAYGGIGWRPVAGDWTGTGHAGVGAFDPASATWYLRNSATGGAPDLAPFAYGGAGWVPVTGHWTGPTQPLRAAGLVPDMRRLEALDHVFACGCAHGGGEEWLG